MSKIEDTLCKRLQERAQTGYEKYGVTMERNDLTEIQWLNHALEEALDLAVYLQKLIVEKINVKNS